MDSNESIGRKLLGKCGQCRVVQIVAAAGVDAHIVAVALHPVDRTRLQRNRTTTVSNDEAIDAARYALGDLRDDAFNRPFKSRVVDRLEDVIERCGVERLERTILMRRDKYDERARPRRELLEQRETVGAWHLDIEKDDVGMLAANLTHARRRVAGFNDNLELRPALQS